MHVLYEFLNTILDMSFTDIFRLSDIQKGNKSIEVGNRLEKNGYITLHLDEDCDLSEDEKWCVNNWENVYRDAFSCCDEIKSQSWFAFDSIKGYTVGYRKDGDREFLETRLSSCSSQGIEPEIVLNSSERETRYNSLVKVCIQLCHKIGKLILACVAETLGVEENYFMHLIDEINMDPVHLMKDDVNASKLSHEEIPLVTDALSSSLLRVCHYPQHNDDIAFGAHTDVSLVTLGLCASHPGLEIRDFHTNEWVQVEKEAYNKTPKYQDDDKAYSVPSIIIFVGDIMQLLTRSIYRATVHRVVVRPSTSGKGTSIVMIYFCCVFL